MTRTKYSFKTRFYQSIAELKKGDQVPCPRLSGYGHGFIDHMLIICLTAKGIHY